MVPDNITDHADTLQSRIDCLKAITNDPQEKRSLTDALDIPRSTLDDIVRELESVDLVVYNDGLWQPTPYGQLACELQCSYFRDLEDLLNCKDILDSLSHPHLLSNSVILDSEVKEPHPNVSGSLMEFILERIGESDSVRMLSPQVSAGYYEQFRELVCSNGADFEIILSPQLRGWWSSKSSASTEIFQKNPSVALYWGEIPYQFGYTILDDDEVIVIVFADRGIAGLILNDTLEAVNWASSMYETIKQNAIPSGEYMRSENIDNMI
jgi:predicted transcriptional regulator